MKRMPNFILLCSVAFVTALVCRWLWRNDAPAAPGLDRALPADEAFPLAGDDDLAFIFPAALMLTEDFRPASNDGAAVESPSRDGRRTVAAPTWTADEIEIAVQVARDVDEKLAIQFERLRRDNPREFRRRLDESTRLKNLVILKQRDPVLYDLKRNELQMNLKVDQLARSLQDAKASGRSAGEVEQLESELRLWVRVQMVLQYRLREDYLCRLQEIVQSLQQELESSRLQFDEQVEQRIRVLLNGGGSASPAGGTHQSIEG